MGKSLYSQDVMLVVMPTGQPGRHRDNLVAVVITGSRRETGSPVRRRTNRVAVGSAGTSRHLQPGYSCAGRDADGSDRSRSGHPGRGRKTGSR